MRIAAGYDGFIAGDIWLQGPYRIGRYGNGRHGQALCLFRLGVMALKAGADMVLVCHDYGHEQETHGGIVREYKANPEFRQMVDEKVMHIVETKLKMNYL